MKRFIILLFSLLCLYGNAQMSPILRFYHGQMGLYKTDTSTYLDADAQRFIDSAGITDATQKAALFRLVADFKGVKNGLYATTDLWSKEQIIYPFLGGTAFSHKWNLKDPRDADDAFRLVYFNSIYITHNSSGVKFHVSSANWGYANTFFIPQTQLAADYSCHISAYNVGVVTSTSTDADLGCGDTLAYAPTPPATAPRFDLNFNYNGGIGTYGTLGSLSARTDYVPNNVAAGFYCVSRTGINYLRGTKNNVQLRRNTATSNIGQPHFPVFIGSTNYNGNPYRTSPAIFAFVSIGAGLTDFEAVCLGNAVQQFEKTLGRSVNY